MIKIFLTLFPFLLFCLNQAVAKAPNEDQKKNARTTEANFTGTTIDGKYVHSPEATVSIEKDKNLIPVVKPRKNLSFRIKKSQEDYK